MANVEWPNKDTWQPLSHEEKLIWSIQILQQEIRNTHIDSPTRQLKLDEAIVLGDFAIQDA